MTKKDDDTKTTKPAGNLTFLGRYRFIIAIIAGVTIAGITLSLTGDTNNRALLFCSTSRAAAKLNPTVRRDYETTPAQLLAILHYATTKEIPQQSNAEVRVTFEVLKKKSNSVNFLVYGVGRDSLMWHSLNPRGKTLFVEEDPSWLSSVLSRSPILDARGVSYTTRLSEADELISSYRAEPDCLPSAEPLSRASRCRLALTTLPDEAYAREWDLIMVDAPRGYFPSAPGRMAAIYSAAVMARARKGGGVTHVFLHDVNRRVERLYAQEFLCEKYRVESVGRLWHFEIPPASNLSSSSSSSSKPTSFCSD